MMSEKVEVEGLILKEDRDKTDFVIKKMKQSSDEINILRIFSGLFIYCALFRENLKYTMMPNVVLWFGSGRPLSSTARVVFDN